MRFGQAPEGAMKGACMAALGFGLYGQMTDAELLKSLTANLPKQGVHAGNVFGTDQGVARHHRQPGFDRPEMDIMDVRDAGDLLNHLLDA